MENEIYVPSQDELGLKHIQEMIRQSAESVHAQAQDLLQEGDTIAYTELYALEIIFSHFASAIEQGCFQQIKPYHSDPSLTPVIWKDL